LSKFNPAHSILSDKPNVFMQNSALEFDDVLTNPPDCLKKSRIAGSMSGREFVVGHAQGIDRQ
jgi:hypothetical protein